MKTFSHTFTAATSFFQYYYYDGDYDNPTTIAVNEAKTVTAHYYVYE